jgi:hypothetical protein
MMVDVIIEALLDTARIIPFLFAAFILMEIIEKKAGSKFVSVLSKTGKLTLAGPPVGGLLGILPQCGFSVTAANLYAGRLISIGTLAAVFLATSDEAIPILLSYPERFSDIWKLIAAKLIIAVFFGIIIDLISKKVSKKAVETDFENICHDCGCHDKGVVVSALKHTLGITIFILVLNLLLGFVVYMVGAEAFYGFLESFGIFQPAAAALVGLIPNCAASVLITELYIDGGLSFGSTVAGLCSGAVVGLLVLFRTNKNIKENLLIVGIIFACGVISGTRINLLL